MSLCRIFLLKISRMTLCGRDKPWWAQLGPFHPHKVYSWNYYQNYSAHWHFPWSFLFFNDFSLSWCIQSKYVILPWNTLYTTYCCCLSSQWKFGRFHRKIFSKIPFKEYFSMITNDIFSINVTSLQKKTLTAILVFKTFYKTHLVQGSAF